MYNIKRKNNKIRDIPKDFPYLSNYDLVVIYGNCKLSLREMSNILKIPKSTIYDRIKLKTQCRSSGEALRLKKKDVNISQGLIAFFSARGWQTRHIAAVLGVSTRTVRRWKSMISTEYFD